jgi:HPt (histidine-containing phosphotransfer) domain-containing protein
MNSLYQINLDYLRVIAKGDEKFMATILELFIKNTPSAIDNIRRYFNASSWDDLMMEAHKIRPSFNFMGLKYLEDTARMIEQKAAKQKDITVVEELILILEKNMDRVYEQVNLELEKFNQLV